MGLRLVEESEAPTSAWLKLRGRAHRLAVRKIHLVAHPAQCFVGGLGGKIGFGGCQIQAAHAVLAGALLGRQQQQVTNARASGSRCHIEVIQSINRLGLQRAKRGVELAKTKRLSTGTTKALAA